ncbi:NAD(P)/FAD-dependent oxidoreductase [Aquimarina sediminis]|uniref:NAD(P)/FAD-dependent oxidoreductase n=1 Tax=Aquimarina sediminis TaxID=2070536 RepID=UPI000CA028A5|nr:FAD-dependent monooxygenase [Aquimarina sediminis]
MTNDKKEYQVIIIGGGPSGIATSLILTAKGISNCVIEAQEQPTRKFGEAIPPNAKPLLKKMGIMHLIENPKHIAYYGNKSCWGSDLLEQKEFLNGIYGHGYLLDRLYFEKQLRKHLKSNSGILLEGYRLKKILNTKKGIEASIQKGNNNTILRSSYIVDATGRKASVCHKLGVVKKNMDTQFAISFKANLIEPIEHQINVEATKNGWWYMAPQHNNELTIMFFTLQELLPEKKLLIPFIRKEMEASLHISKLTKIAKIDFENINVIPSGTSRLDIPYGDNWIAVGDAAFSYDPISSYGITSALASGFYAGHALASQLSNKKDAMLTYRFIIEKAFQAYMEKLSSHYTEENRWKDEPYWKNRFLKKKDRDSVLINFALE